MTFTDGRDSVISYPLTVNGVKTRVVEAGTGGVPTICLHGTGSRADRWIPAMARLSQVGLHPMALDFPGHGFADKDQSLDYSAPAFASFVRGAMDTLCLKSAVIMGTSLGGHVAAILAADSPELVEGLVLIGTTGITEFPKEYWRPAELVADTSERNIRSKLALLVSSGDLVTDEWIREETMINSSPGAREALWRTATYLNEGTNEDLQADRLNSADIGRNTLIVWGEADGWTPPSMAHSAHESLPSSILEMMPGCGHAPYFEDPDTFVQIVAKFLDERLGDLRF